MNITVYLSSKTDIDCKFSEAVTELGKALGKSGHTLIYGGSNAGQMHMLAEMAKRNGAKVIGIIPEIFRHIADPLADEMIYTKDLSERKAKLYEMGDAFVALPGGIGTLDEVMSTLAEMTVTKKFDKKIILININGLYDPIIEQLKIFEKMNLADHKAVDSIISVNSVEECIDQLR